MIGIRFVQTGRRRLSNKRNSDKLQGMDMTNEEAIQTVASRIRELMEQRGITSNAELARLCGENTPTIHKLVNGNGTVNYPTLARVAAGLGVTLDDLLPLTVAA